MTYYWEKYYESCCKEERKCCNRAIVTEYIKLQDALKFANVVYSGGEAKTLVQEGAVTVNGEVCTMRGKKLYPGDKFGFEGETYLITNAAE